MNLSKANLIKLGLALQLIAALLLGCRHLPDSKLTDSVPLSGSDGDQDLSFGNQEQFFFGLATAPAHAEDHLNDAWLDFARSGHVAAWSNQIEPERRLDFWSDPDTEIDLAAATGVKVFRLGVDWGRLVPSEGASLDQSALARYQLILDKIHAKNMRVMLTLFHHSLPIWAINKGGWTNPEVGKAFTAFGKQITDHLAVKVDYWIVFNEPAVFALLTYVAGFWPPGSSFDPLAILPLPGAVNGAFFKALDNMTASQKALFEYIHANATQNNKPALVGVAHNVGHQIAATRIDLVAAKISEQIVNYAFLDRNVNFLDFIGLNYYGAELLSGPASTLRPEFEYSESGRLVDPQGLYQVFKAIHRRYNVEFKNRKKHDTLPFIVTENGISDGTDILRPAYLIEHLKAVKALINEGIPVLGYIFWTTSDNWEWMDGYCPKFGLVAVDRADQLKRVKRPSYDLFTKIVQQGGFTAAQAGSAWNLVVDHVGQPRTFCRLNDGKTSANQPFDRPVVKFDWRFLKDRPMTNAKNGPYEP